LNDGHPKRALRLGLRMVDGLGRAAADRLVAARTERPFACVDDLVERAALSRKDREGLAAAGALRGLAGHRRLARWEALGAESHPLPLLRGVRVPEPAPRLAPPTEGEDLLEDYAALGLTLGRHPIALLRDRLARQHWLPAARVNALPDGRAARVAGIVVTRQRPGTAKDVTFVTLEDETGTANIVVWRDLADRQHRELVSSRLLAVAGKIQREGAVVHLIARRLADLSHLLGELDAPSRDFR
jgi:error-prone DNA polymerase